MIATEHVAETKSSASASTWTEAQRQAALAALAAEFQMTVSEDDVYRAAALFFALVRDGVFIEKGRVAARMHEERARAATFAGVSARPVT